MNRRFRIIIFDWDGTAVTDRAADARELARALEDVHRAGIQCAIVAGTNFQNIDRQCLKLLSIAAKRPLIVCTNRGSEVFSFSDLGEPLQIYRRLASQEENRSLDRAARKFQSYLRSRGLQSEIVFNRMNRRKIDLIPVEPWKDPKKSEFSALLRAVETRLAATSIRDLAELANAAVRIAREEGLKDPRVTSDIKHIEIGLTDKSDSVAWLLQHLIGKQGIQPADVVIVGDEFGSIAGLPGSDSWMRIPGLNDATYISVGAEPNGTPDWVQHLAGGVPRFVEFLRDQTLAAPALASEGDPSWKLEQEGFDPSREREVEPLFAIGNGFVGARACLSIPLPSSETDLFVAGIYDRKIIQIPYFGAMTSEERSYTDAELVPFPSPFTLSLRVDGREINALQTPVESLRRTLDLRTATLSESLAFEITRGSTVVMKTERYASLRDVHLLVQKIEIQSKKEHAFELETRIAPDDMPINHPHLNIRSDQPAGVAERVSFQTRASGFDVSICSRVFLSGSEISGTGVGPVRLLEDRPLTIWRLMSVFSNREVPDAAAASLEHCRSVHPFDIEERLGEHRQDWSRFWSAADLQIDAAPSTLQALRFGAYQLRISADRDPRISIGAKGLTGRAYEGHVFWDADTFAFPFFMKVDPSIAKNIVLYRYNTLQGARERARSMGCEGACYAWESTLSGRDVTPEKLLLTIDPPSKTLSIPIFTGKQQIHITADVAFSVWNYWNESKDVDFLVQAGAEILIETARFWASRVTDRQNAFHIDGVVGPDEYHHSVNDNAFTNWMAKFNLEKTLYVADWMRSQLRSEWERIANRLALRSGELQRWEAVLKKLFIPLPDKHGIIEQFEGFHALREPDRTATRNFGAPIDRLYAWDEANRTKVLKQADVLMIPFLLPELFDRETCAANFDYYEPITDHGSSLSPCVHAAIAYRAGRIEKSLFYWEISRNIDLLNLMKNTSFGVHIGAIGGAWQALVRHMRPKARMMGAA